LTDLLYGLVVSYACNHNVDALDLECLKATNLSDSILLALYPISRNTGSSLLEAVYGSQVERAQLFGAWAIEAVLMRCLRFAYWSLPSFRTVLYFLFPSDFTSLQVVHSAGHFFAFVVSTHDRLCGPLWPLPPARR